LIDATDEHAASAAMNIADASRTAAVRRPTFATSDSFACYLRRLLLLSR